MRERVKKYRLLKDWVTPWGAVRAGTIYVKGVNCYVPAFPQQVAQLAISHPYDYPDWFAPVEPEPWRPQRGEHHEVIKFSGGEAYAEAIPGWNPDSVLIAAGRVYPLCKGAYVADEINALLQKRSREVGE